MSIASELITLVADACQHRSLPPLSWLHLPPKNPRDPHHKKFGALVLADGSCGFFFTRLGDSLGHIRAQIDVNEILRTPILDLAAGYASDDLMTRTLGLGALNAISQHLFAESEGVLEESNNPLGQLELDSGHHVGMVGFFRPLVRMLGERRVPLTVIEKEGDYLDYEGPVKVTLDTTALKHCDRVLVTASTLLNNSLETVLSNCAPTAQIALIGPTVGCLPDPFFARGVDVVGGAKVADLTTLKKRLEIGDNWGKSVSKYCISQQRYSGLDVLTAG